MFDNLIDLYQSHWLTERQTIAVHSNLCLIADRVTSMNIENSTVNIDLDLSKFNFIKTLHENETYFQTSLEQSPPETIQEQHTNSINSTFQVNLTLITNVLISSKILNKLLKELSPITR